MFWAGRAKDSTIGLGDFCSISPQRAKTNIFRGCLILDNTPSIASIIPDDADDVMRAGDPGGVLGMLSPKSGQFCRTRAT